MPFDLRENIITQLGLESLPEERKMQIYKQVADVVQKRLVLRILQGLNEADLKAAEPLANDPEAFLQFAASRTPNLADIMVEEIEAVKATLAQGL